MNAKPGPNRASSRLPQIFASLLAVALLAAGCHKAEEAAAPPPPAAPAPAPAAAAPDNNQGTQAAAPAPADNPGHVPMGGPVLADPQAPSLVKPNGDPDLHQIDEAMLGWVMSHRRAPSSFAEFAATAGVAIPPPPPGKKYAFSSSMHVILLNANQ